MKKWKKVTITVVCAAAVVCAAGFGSYELYFKPKYAIPMAEKAAEVLKDEELQQQVLEIAQQLAEDGNLEDGVLQSIIGVTENQDADGEAADTPSDGEAADTSSDGSSEEDTASADASSGSDSAATSAESSSSGTDTSSSTGSTSSSTSSSKGTGSTAYERIMSAASADEIAKGSAILSKVSVSTFTSLLKTDRKAAKEYLYSRLSASEISTALQLYAKYSYLL